ncbi:unnamed protein product [Durusdinium trenchii]
MRSTATLHMVSVPSVLDLIEDLMNEKAHPQEIWRWERCCQVERRTWRIWTLLDPKAHGRGSEDASGKPRGVPASDHAELVPIGEQELDRIRGELEARLSEGVVPKIGTAPAIVPKSMKVQVVRGNISVCVAGGAKPDKRLRQMPQGL